MAGLFGRIFRQWFENAIVDKLAESRTMQRVAVGAVKSAQEAQRMAEEASKDPGKVKEGFFALVDALKREASKDFSSLGMSSGGEGSSSGSAMEAKPPPAPPCPWKTKSIKELKEECSKRGISTAGMMEKSEIIAAIKEHKGPKEELR